MNLFIKRIIGASLISSCLLVGTPSPTFSQQQTVIDLQVKRAIDAAQNMDSIPNAGKLDDGDYIYFTLTDGVICGLLYKEQPKEAVYVICEDEVVSRPLTTVGEIEAVTEVFYEQLQKGSNDAGQVLSRRIRESWPIENNTQYRLSKPNVNGIQ